MFFLLLTIANHTIAQITVTGTVYDSTKIVPVKNVIIKSNSGKTTQTDSAGHYSIEIAKDDSLVFIYNNKATAKFSSKQISDNGVMDISLHVRVYDKYKTMKEVRVFSKTYRQDSLENRITYADIFNHQKPGIQTTTPEYGAAAGMDLDAFIDMFKFKKNKRIEKFRERLIAEEQEKYIDYRFNRQLVKRITRLEGTNLDEFMKMYRPDFVFAETSSTLEFYQYILSASYEYKKTHPVPNNPPPTQNSPTPAE